MSALQTTMETLQEAITRLESQGFDRSFRATEDGRLIAPGFEPVDPEALVVESALRFEGQSDPGDSAVLFALRSPDSRIRGTFVTSFGPAVDPRSAAVIERLGSGP